MDIFIIRLFPASYMKLATVCVCRGETAMAGVHVEHLYTSIPVASSAAAADERVETLGNLVDAVVESERIRCAAVCCR